MYTSNTQLLHRESADGAPAPDMGVHPDSHAPSRSRVSTRVLATQTLADQMVAEAQRYGKMTGSVQAVLRAAKLRQRSAWLYSRRAK